jgi:anaphase-promoting complex subunit 1
VIAVRRCIGALSSVLKRDVAMQLLVKWYCARNAPGSQDITAHAEWQLFLAALLGNVHYFYMQAVSAWPHVMEVLAT